MRRGVNENNAPCDGGFCDPVGRINARACYLTGFLHTGKVEARVDPAMCFSGYRTAIRVGTNNRVPVFTTNSVNSDGLVGCVGGRSTILSTSSVEGVATFLRRVWIGCEWEKCFLCPLFLYGFAYMVC